MPGPVTLDILLERYDALLLDAYGVLVTLDGALPGAVALIERLNRSGKPYWVLSNTAARLPEHAAARYRGFGLELEAGRILTSGMLLARYFREQGLVGRACLVLGPEDSRAYVERAGGRPVLPGEDFEVVVLADQAGFPLLETLDWLVTALFAKLEGGGRVPLILPNPDLIYPTRQGFGLTAGSLAVLLEAVLTRRFPDRADLRFEPLGKPRPGLFEAAAGLAGSRNLVMLGDQLETDILGAVSFGIDAVLILGGVTRAGQVLQKGGVKPTYAIDSLADLLKNSR